MNEMCNIEILDSRYLYIEDCENNKIWGEILYMAEMPRIQDQKHWNILSSFSDIYFYSLQGIKYFYVKRTLTK